MKQFIHIRPTDNVIITLENIEKDNIIEVKDIKIQYLYFLGYGHKMVIKEKIMRLVLETNFGSFRQLVALMGYRNK